MPNPPEVRHLKFMEEFGNIWRRAENYLWVMMTFSYNLRVAIFEAIFQLKLKQTWLRRLCMSCVRPSSRPSSGHRAEPLVATAAAGCYGVFEESEAGEAGGRGGVFELYCRFQTRISV